MIQLLEQIQPCNSYTHGRQRGPTDEFSQQFHPWVRYAIRGLTAWAIRSITPDERCPKKLYAIEVQGDQGTYVRRREVKTSEQEGEQRISPSDQVLRPGRLPPALGL